MKTKEIRPRQPLTEAGINFSIAAVVPVLLSFVALLVLGVALGERYQESVIYSFTVYFIPQLCFAVACLIWFRRTRTSAKQVYAPCKWYYYALAVMLAFGLLFALNQVNEYFIRFLELIGYTRLDQQPDYAAPITDALLSGWYLLPAFLIIAVLPAIFEETVFRGIQVQTLQKSGWGTVPTVLICGAMFSLFHGNPEQTLYQFICGACYALLAIRSGSPLPSMLAHFLNNAFVLGMGAVFGVNWVMPETVAIVLTLTAAAVLVAVVVYLIYFDRHGNQKGGMQEGKKYFLAAGIGIAVCAVEWIAVFAQGLIA